MSTLSELLPAGSGGKNVDFVASGTLPNGQAVALNANGTVQAVSETNITASLGTVNSLGTQGTRTQIAGYYDPDQNACVIFFSGSSDYLTGVAGTISGSTITFGSVTTGLSFSTERYVAAYDTTNNKGVVVYKDSGQTGDWKAKQVNVSGTTISFESGSGQTFSTHSSARPVAMIYAPNVDRFFSVWNSSSQGTLVHQMGQTSGTTTSWSGAYNSFNGTNFNAYDAGWAASLTYDPVYEAVLIAQTYRYSPYYMSYMLVTLQSSGSALPSLTQQALNNYYSDTPFAAYNVNDAKHVLAYRVSSGMDVVPITLTSNSAVSFTTPTVSTGNFGPTIGNNNVRDANGIGYNALHKKTGLMYSDSSGVQHIVSIDTSGSTYTTGTSLQVQNTYIASVQPRPVLYDSSSTDMFIAFKSGASGTTYDGRTYTMEGSTTNVSDFIGITDAAIADTATGSVTIKGGIGIAQATSQSNSLGSAQLFNDGTTNYSKVVYDSNSDRIVVIFADNSNLNYGTAIVGEVSGSSVQYGTKEVFNTGTASYMDITFDSNSNRVVIAFTGTPANEYGTAIVGSVDPSDNSIDFGTASVYKSATCSFNTCTFDSSNNKVVVGYRIYPSPQGIARVGTVDPSDNSISFTGAESVYVNGDLANQSSTFDSSNNKVVITFQDGTNTGRGTAIVGTVSGTGISFGSKVDFSGANNTNYSLPVTFDSNSNKIVVLYSGPASNYLGRAKVGTISGTAITFGSEATFEPSNVVRYKAIAFDSTANKVIIVYDENQTDLKYVVGTVSGTDITFETPTIFSTSNGVGDGSLDVAYDSSINRSVFAFRDESNSNKGTSQVLALAGILENLTPNNVYYVQSDGTISTNSAGTRIGKALSTTSINLEFNS